MFSICSAVLANSPTLVSSELLPFFEQFNCKAENQLGVLTEIKVAASQIAPAVFDAIREGRKQVTQTNIDSEIRDETNGLNAVLRYGQKYAEWICQRACDPPNGILNTGLTWAKDRGDFSTISSSIDQIDRISSLGHLERSHGMEDCLYSAQQIILDQIRRHAGR